MFPFEMVSDRGGRYMWHTGCQPFVHLENYNQECLCSWCPPVMGRSAEVPRRTRWVSVSNKPAIIVKFLLCCSCNKVHFFCFVFREEDLDEVDRRHKTSKFSLYFVYTTLSMDAIKKMPVKWRREKKTLSIVNLLFLLNYGILCISGRLKLDGFLPEILLVSSNFHTEGWWRHFFQNDTKIRWIINLVMKKQPDAR